MLVISSGGWKWMQKLHPSFCMDPAGFTSGDKHTHISHRASCFNSSLKWGAFTGIRVVHRGLSVSRNEALCVPPTAGNRHEAYGAVMCQLFQHPTFIPAAATENETRNQNRITGKMMPEMDIMG
ncbi:hypothetical protein KIL84_008252 [Mauremys mutica]|uniref:Uncharacterized protein n=1 Tax=Mauremys mutica TaxID=74926 RepID=A0A9D4AYM7_9SAUR|nr:hypothetical protein KIL84_008252 [Mauremys mutica]